MASAEMCEATIRLRIEPLQEGGFVATSPDVPGLVAEGRSLTETVQLAQSITRELVEFYLDRGHDLPPALAKMVSANEPIELTIPVGVR